MSSQSKQKRKQGNRNTPTDTATNQNDSASSDSQKNSTNDGLNHDHGNNGDVPPLPSQFSQYGMSVIYECKLYMLNISHIV